MGQPLTTARSRRQARHQRQREGSVTLAASLSVLTTLLVAIVITVVLINLPGTPTRNFFLLNVMNRAVSPGSDLYQDLLAQIERQEVFFNMPFCLLTGGLVLGRLMPRRITRIRLLKTASVTGAGIFLGSLFFRWGLILYGQHWHLVQGEISTQLFLTQAVCSLAWLAVYMLGTWLGVLWRDSRHRNGDDRKTESSAALTR